MSINATLLGQMITFAIFVWFCMKFIWPRLMAAIYARQKMIADGLAAADRSQRELEATQMQITDMLNTAKQQANDIVETAQQRSARIIEEARNKARTEANHIISSAQAEIELARNAAKQTLLAEVGALAVLGAQKIIERHITADDTAQLVHDLISKVQH